MTSTFGPVLTSVHVEQAVEAHIKKWLPTYIAEMERQAGLDPRTLSLPRSYARHDEFTKWPEEQLPCILIIAPTLDGDVLKEGRGLIRATFLVGVAAIVSGRDKQTTKDHAALTGAAIRLLMLQQQAIEGLDVRAVDWRDEGAESVPDERSRTLAASSDVFGIEVAAVLDQSLGPAEPAVDPYAVPGAGPVVATTSVTTNQLP